MSNCYYQVAAVKEALTSVVPSVNPVFDKDGEINWKKTADLMDFMIEGGAKTLLLTYGDSLVSSLSVEETLKFNEVLTDVGRDRVMTIACSPMISMKEHISFAEHVKEVGADVYIPMFVDWAGSQDYRLLAQCYKTLGKILPLMVLTTVEPAGLPYDFFSLISPEDGLVAVKDDKAMPYGKDLGPAIRDRFAFLSGGTASMFLEEAPYGADGYLSVFARCFPKVGQDFWKAYTAGDMEEAKRLIAYYEGPVRKIWGEMHFDAVMHGMQELAGVGTRWRRAPYGSLSDAEMEKLADILRQIKLL